MLHSFLSGAYDAVARDIENIIMLHLALKTDDDLIDGSWMLPSHVLFCSLCVTARRCLFTWKFIFLIVRIQILMHLSRTFYVDSPRLGFPLDASLEIYIICSAAVLSSFSF